MRAFTEGRRERWPAGAAFLLLACALSAPSEARAGCSHYVTSRAGQDHLGHFLDPSILGATDRPAAAPLPRTAPDLPRPAPGRSCAGAPAPPAAPAVTEVRYVEPWACLGETPGLPGLGSSPLPTGPPDPHPVVAASGIFHPPRGRAPHPIA